ncbi:MAG TPA: glycosyltransferase, partial [Candidatus Angelobacter sp.]
METQLEGTAAAIAELPRNLRDYRDYHKDETILVCGCGASLAQVVSPEKLITIGVNDVGRLFHPDYLVILNPRSQFASDRFKYVENSQAGAIFTQLNLGISHPNIVRFRLGQRGGTELRDDESLPYTRNSPYVALCLAVFMGARRIGLIGVDFTNDHFFARTGVHPLSREFPQIDREYRQLYEACRGRGIEIFNLSEQSRLTALPKMPFQEFAALSRQAERLNVVSYSVTPVAGVPVILSQCIAARTAHNCRTVWASNTYGNGVSFPGDVEWGAASAEAEQLLCSADLIIAHNGKVAPRHKNLLAGKPVITMAHNYMWNVDTSYVQQKFPGVVVGQYQATLPDFTGWQVVPNPVPLWDSNFQPGPKNPEITICYTPSGKHEKYPPNHRLYWHSKGYATTMRVLDRLARRFPIRLETLNGQQVAHAKSLAMKQRSHIVIDECVTGSYHRNSLEGLAAGCVVVNAVGHLPAVKDVFHYCSGSDQVPFVYATLEDLERVLEQLIERGVDALTAEGARNHAWMEEHWDFEKQWGRFWEPVVDHALQRAHSGSEKPRPARVQPQRQSVATAEQQFQTQVSVVVCQGGQERLRQLAACLVTLRQCRQVGEIIVVDMGRSPFAAELGRRWANKYVFVKNDGVFERARSLNIGTALAEHDLVLWIDNDLIVSPEFVSKAVAEMSRRQLDYLIPYTQVKYLSEIDTQQIMMGTRNPDDCPPASVLRAPRGATGGMGLVKKSFVQTYGGMQEEFRGWGGEDDAWWHKARLLGRAAATEQRDQQVYHMFHANSGCYARQKQSNPLYGANLAVLREIWSIRDRQKF